MRLTTAVLDLSQLHGRSELYNTTEGCETCVPGKYSYDNLNAYCVDCGEYLHNITRTECAPDQNRECEDRAVFHLRNCI